VALDPTPAAPDVQPFPTDAWALLRRADRMAGAIASVTGDAVPDVRRRLWREFLLRGGTVRRAAREHGVTRYVFDEAMARLYAGSDAFLYELAVWNLNLLKRGMRSFCTRWITRMMGPGQRVLTWGDGLGFDALALAQAGHQVTSFEPPGHPSTFATRMHAAARSGVRLVTDAADLEAGGFDAVVCLDVLEHVPDVDEALRELRARLRPGGTLIVHAPFYFIHRVSVTHLKANRRHSGSLALFRRAGFRLRDAQPTWAPLVLSRDDGEPARRPLLAWPRLAVALPLGLVAALGRVTALPFEAVNLTCRLAQPWFPDDMFRRAAPAPPS
jgi:SAM-dependent methyltransferase